jgi:hypothetical protein
VTGGAGATVAAAGVSVSWGAGCPAAGLALPAGLALGPVVRGVPAEVSRRSRRRELNQARARAVRSAWAE